MTNRFKGLDLIDRVSEELWTEFVTLSGGRDQDHPQGGEKAKWLSDKALKIAEKIREDKG